jgi:hypothetical protein
MMHKLRTAAGSYLKRKTEQNTIDLSESYACLLGLRNDKFSKSNQRIASVRIAVLGANQKSFKQYITSEFRSSHQSHLTDRELQSSHHRREFKRIQSIESLIFESDTLIQTENPNLTAAVSRKIMQVHQTVTERYFNKYMDEFNFFFHLSEDSDWHLFYSLIGTIWPKKRDFLWKPPL